MDAEVNPKLPSPFKNFDLFLKKIAKRLMTSLQNTRKILRNRRNRVPKVFISIPRNTTYICDAM
jgi:hypothetical protein